MYPLTRGITPHLSTHWKEKYANLFAIEHWSTLINQFNRYLNENPTELRLPYFSKEVTPPIPQIMDYFKSAYNTAFQAEKRPQKIWAKVYNWYI